MNVAKEIAQHLAGQALVTYDEEAFDADCFLFEMPSEPDEAVMLRVDAGTAPDAKLGYDSPDLQLIVRGAVDGDIAPLIERGYALYGALQGLNSLELPGGTWLVSCFGYQSGPVYMRKDENRRHELSINFRLEVRNVTKHRE